MIPGHLHAVPELVSKESRRVANRQHWGTKGEGRGMGWGGSGGKGRGEGGEREGGGLGRRAQLNYMTVLFSSVAPLPGCSK